MLHFGIGGDEAEMEAVAKLVPLTLTRGWPEVRSQIGGHSGTSLDGKFGSSRKDRKDDEQF